MAKLKCTFMIALALVVVSASGFLQTGSSHAFHRPESTVFAPVRQVESEADIDVARFRHLSTAEGLSYLSVTAIHQDSRGFMWFGTQGGLNKYDGYRFTIFRHDPSDENSLSADHVMTLSTDGDGTLWVGTLLGLDRLDRATGRFVHFLAGYTITSIVEDRDGTLWVGTDDGLWAMEPGAEDLVERFPHDLERPDDPDRLSSTIVTTLLEGQDGALWIGTVDGLDRLDPDRLTLTHYGYDPADLNSLTDPRITALYEDGAGQLWIGTQAGGLFRLLPESGIFVRFGHRPGDPDSLSGAPITSIAADGAGTLWIGTFDGLNLHLAAQSTFLHIRHDPSDPRSLADNLITALYRDRSGIIWVGTILGGVSRYDARAGWFDVIQPGGETVPGLTDRVVFAVEEDSSGAVWVGTIFGGVNRLDLETGAVKAYTYEEDDPTSLRSTRVDTIYADSRGTIWVGTETGWLERYVPDDDRFEPVRNLGRLITEITENRAGDLIIGTTKGAVRLDRETGIHISLNLKLADTAIQALYEDRNGLLWVGTDCEGIDVFESVDEATRRPGESPYRLMAHYEHDPEDPASLGHDCAYSIWEDYADPGVVWIGTWGGGLDRFDRVTETFAHFGAAQGLPTEIIGCVVGDEKGYLWVGAGSGLARFNPQTETFRIFDEGEGLPPSAMVSCTEGPSGRIYFGGVDGLVVFDPSVIEENPQRPPVVITSFNIYGETIERDLEPDEEIVLPHDANFVSFEFAALDYMDPAKNQYAYRMENLDPDWVYAGGRRYADYPNLGPGEYVFRVRGSNSDGIWNEEGAAVRLTIRPPFWATWWFRGAAVLLVIAGLVGGVRLRLRTIESRNRELAHLVEERTREIEQRRRVAEGLRDIVAVLNSDRPLGDVLDYVVAQAQTLMGAEAAVLHRLEPGVEWIDVEASAGLPVFLAGLKTIPLSASGADEAILDRRPFIIEDLAAGVASHEGERDGGAWLAAARQLYGSFLAVPLVVGGAVDRCLAFYFAGSQTFADERVRLAVALADQAALAIANAQLRAQVEQSAVAEERGRLARELHDSVTQSLYSLTLLAEAGQRTAANGQLESAERTLGRVGEIGQQALREMRLLVYQLRPLALEEEGLVGALQQRLDAVERRAGVEARLIVDGDLELPPMVEEALYRIAQEALNNALKHANPTAVEVTIRAEGGRVELRVRDNGAGFDVDCLRDEGGLGLVSMRERAESVGGEFAVDSVPGEGTEIRIVTFGGRD